MAESSRLPLAALKYCAVGCTQVSEFKTYTEESPVPHGSQVLARVLSWQSATAPLRSALDSLQGKAF